MSGLKLAALVSFVLAFSTFSTKGAVIQSSLTSTASQSAFPCSATDLINAGQPTLRTNTPTANQGYGNPAALNNGSIGAPNTLGTDGVGNESAWTATFHLDTSVNTNGYTITNLSTFASWSNGRVNQQYDLLMAFQGDSTPGAFYLVGNGVYNVTNPVVINNFMILRSANGASNAIVRSSSGTTNILQITAPFVVVDGFTIRDANSTAIYMTGGTVQNCILTGNSNGTYGAIQMKGGTVSGCAITGNSATSYGGGIFMENPGGQVANCIIRNNAASTHGGGIHLFQTTADVIIRNCLIDRNIAAAGHGGGISCFGAGARIQNCTIVSNRAGIAGGGAWLDNLSTIGMTNTIVDLNRAPADSELNSGFVAKYSCASAWDPANKWTDGNITTPPLFNPSLPTHR